MGGGDLNMKKSWHPLLLKNQERVWLEEKKSLEEKKKLDQLRKEKEEERQLQELQRLQEQQTGKKRTEKLEWMYSTPATGSSQNPNDVEDYLLGKKRVDKMLTADENAQLGAAHKNFIAVQNANNARDIASKIREDPLLAIKQQEQAAYQALLTNPLRLKKMQQELGVKPKKDKKEKKREKEERKRLKHEQKHRSHSSRTPSPSARRIERGRSPSVDRYHDQSRSYSRSRSPPPRRFDDESRYSRRRSPDYERGNASRSPMRARAHDDKERSHPAPGSSRSIGYEGRSDVPPRRDSPPRRSDYGKRSRSRSPRRRSPPPKRSRYEGQSNGPSNGYTNGGSSYSSRPSEPSKADADRTARLAAMQSNANSMTDERQKRLAEMLEKEKADLAADTLARAKSKGMSSFLSQEQKKVFGGSGGLEDRIRRGRGGMVVDAE